jgi:hypothetical protein
LTESIRLSAIVKIFVQSPMIMQSEVSLLSQRQNFLHNRYAVIITVLGLLVGIGSFMAYLGIILSFAAGSPIVLACGIIFSVIAALVFTIAPISYSISNKKNTGQITETTPLGENITNDTKEGSYGLNNHLSLTKADPKENSVRNESNHSSQALPLRMTEPNRLIEEWKKDKKEFHEFVIQQQNKLRLHLRQRHQASKKEWMRTLKTLSFSIHEEMKKRYRTLCRKYHSDKNPGHIEAAEAAFKELQNLYDVLWKNHIPYSSDGHIEIGDGFLTAIDDFINGLDKAAQAAESKLYDILKEHHRLLREQNRLLKTQVPVLAKQTAALKAKATIRRERNEQLIRDSEIRIKQYEALIESNCNNKDIEFGCKV